VHGLLMVPVERVELVQLVGTGCGGEGYAPKCVLGVAI
jgi:hypothetical protein